MSGSGYGPQAGVFAAAVQWLQGALLGTTATGIAVIAVASVGLLLLRGRLDVRRAGQVILGCFILFGAAGIASGIVGTITGSGEAQPAPVAPPSPLIPAVPAPAKPAVATPYDPYAGAALPSRR